MLVERLHVEKWKAVERRFDHSDPVPVENGFKYYDAREAVRQKWYYQCLLRVPGIFTYAPVLPSDEVQSFYWCALKGIRVEPRLGDKHYRKLLKLPEELAIEDAPEPAAPSRFALGGPPNAEAERAKRSRAEGAMRARGKARAKAPQPIVDKPLGAPTSGHPEVDPGTGGGSSGDPPPPKAPPPLPPPLADPPAPSRFALAPAPPVAKAKAEPTDRQRGERSYARVRKVFEPVFWSQEFGIWFDPLYQPPSGAPPYATWMLKCNKCGKACEKHKTTSANNLRTYGKVEPLAFLHAWSLLEETPDKLHRRSDPKDADVAVLLRDETNRRGYEALISRWGA